MRFLFGTALLAAVCLIASGQSDPDATRTFEELILARNLTLQAHNVETADGYIIVVHRVVPKNINPAIYSAQRKPVIAFHGLMCQSSIFYINTACLSASAPDCKDNFGLRMALDGSKYDLWVPNARGNGVSMGHTGSNFPSDSLLNQNFWKFSWEQMGRYDLPAVIDYVLQQTGHKSVGYIGYSQGGGSALAMSTMLPAYANKLKPFIGWAPAAYLKDAPSITNIPVQLLAPVLALTPGKFIVTDDLFGTLASQFCPDLILDLPAGLCSAALEAVVGQTNAINITRMPVIFNFFPALVSNWQMVHYGQQFATGRFAHYDYGLLGICPYCNMKQYGSLTNPDFDLSKIPKNLTIFIFNGATDALVTPTNTLKLINNLKAQGITTVVGNVVANPDPANPTDASKAKWNHLDFLTGTGAGALVYDKTIKYLDDNTVWDGPPRQPL